MSDKTTADYNAEAHSDALETVREFMEQIIFMLREDGETSRDLFNDYHNGDRYHHERHTDRDYDLLEAATLLDQLDDHEETDSGLWEGLKPQRAISCQAAYTYGNAVYWHWQEMVKAINADAANGILADMLGEDDPALDDVIKGRIIEICEGY